MPTSSITCLEEDTKWKSRYDDLKTFLKNKGTLPRAVNLQNQNDAALIFEGRLYNWISNQRVHYGRNNSSNLWSWRVPKMQELGIDITTDVGASAKAGGTTARVGGYRQKATKRDCIFRTADEWSAIFDKYDLAKNKPGFRLLSWLEKQNINYYTFKRRMRRRKKEEGLSKDESDEDKDDGDDSEDEREREKPEAKAEDIPKYLTSDLWSDDAEVVEDALDSLDKLASESEDNFKKIFGLAGHMFILTALKKNAQKEAAAQSALVLLYNLIVANTSDQIVSSMVEQLRSADAVDAILKALAVNTENTQSVLCAFGILESMIGKSLVNARAFCYAQVSLEMGKNKSNKRETNALGLIAHYMKKFPISCTCGFTNDNDNEEALLSCQKCDQQVHVAAIQIIKVLAQYAELRDTVVASDCFGEIARCIQGTVTPGTQEKSRLHLEACKVMVAFTTSLDAAERKENNGNDDINSDETPPEANVKVEPGNDNANAPRASIVKEEPV